MWPNINASCFTCYWCFSMGNWSTITMDTIRCALCVFGYVMPMFGEDNKLSEIHICDTCVEVVHMASQFVNNYMQILANSCTIYKPATWDKLGQTSDSFQDGTFAGPFRKFQVKDNKCKNWKQTEDLEQLHHLFDNKLESEVWCIPTMVKSATIQTFFNDFYNFHLPRNRKMYLHQENGGKLHHSPYDLDKVLSPQCGSLLSARSDLTFLELLKETEDFSLASRKFPNIDLSHVYQNIDKNRWFDEEFPIHNHYQHINAPLNKNDLSLHIKTHTELRPPHSCLTCNRSFTSRQNLLRHYLMHSVCRPHLCQQCNKSFARKDHLNRHILTHTTPKQYNCTVCTLSFLCISALHRHCDIEHGHKRFFCAICRKSFALMSNLKQHQLHHLDRMSYTCAVCNKSFKCKAYLRKHVRTHDQHKPFSCAVCKRSYSRRYNLNRHYRIHTGKLFVCTVCDKEFFDRINLRRHFLVHTGDKPFSCPVCHKAFLQKSNLKIHERIHSDEKPFACAVCDASFTQKNQLDKHVLMHRGEAPFCCSICQKSFRAKSILNKHILTHSVQKPYPCLFCSKSFVARCKLNKHVIIHHTKIHPPINSSLF